MSESDHKLKDFFKHNGALVTPNELKPMPKGAVYRHENRDAPHAGHPTAVSGLGNHLRKTL